MTHPAAPFDLETAQAWPGARAVWARAADGVRLRVAHLGAGDKGTVLLVPGRTEYVEKYGGAGRAFAARGYATLSLDYRGQGLADRTGANRLIGRVADFAEYQRDIDAMVAFARAAELPEPWFLVGHSLGGAIGLRALARGLPVRAAVFSAPMWGIVIAPALKPVAWGLGWTAHMARAEGWLAPGTGRRHHVLTATTQDNLLTTDAEMLALMRRQIEACPDLELAGPSVPWLYRALVECRSLARIADPGVPTLTVIPGDERIVCTTAMRRAVARWPRAAHLDMPGGRHETMMETAPRRAAFFDAAAAHFAAAGGSDRDLAEGVA